MGCVKKHLATTGISEMWDLDSPEILFLGPWCFSEDRNRRLIEGRPYSIIPSPWKPAIKIKEAADLCNGIYVEIFYELTDRLNLLHSASYSQKYWRILIGPWLRYFIEILYERYKRIENAFTLFPDIHTYVLPPTLCSLATLDTYDFVSIRGKATEDYYNLKLFSLITRYLYPEKAIEKYNSLPSVEKVIGLKSKISKRLFYKANKVISLFFYPNVILSDMYHLDLTQILDLEFNSSLNRVIFDNFTDRSGALKRVNYSQDFRHKLRFEGKYDKFNALLRQLIPSAIPMCYVENFNKYRKKVKAVGVKVVGSAVGFYFNENFKFFAAEETSRGVKLIDFQHGGGYGISLSCPAETTSLEKDVFYTWGWRSLNNKNTMPLASPYLSRLRDNYKFTENNILFVGNNIHRYLNSFMTIFTPDDIPQYFLDKKRFVDVLGQSQRSELLYRPYQEVGWNEVVVIKNLMPGISILSKGRLIDWMKKFKIVVIDHLSTSNMEALVINVPTIWFWDPDIWLIRPEAEKYFDLLRDVGILYNTPEEAARKVNEINDNPLNWWRDPKIQKARDLFCNEFALSSNNWREEWNKILNEYK